MDRKEFLNKLGVGAAFILTVPCLHSCSSDSIEPLQEGENQVDFLVDLSDPANAPLARNGGFVITNKIVVAKTIDGQFTAATLECSHQGFEEIVYDERNIWFCTRHGAEFDLNGNGLNPNGRNGLTIYTVEQDGDMLRIFG